MGCVLIVLAAVSWPANSRTWSFSTCAPVTHSGSDHLKPWCGRQGLLLIKSINGHGRAHRGVPIVGIYATWGGHWRRCEAGMLRVAKNKCNWQNSCNVSSRWLSNRARCAIGCVKLVYTCITLKAKRSGWARCGGGRLYVAPFTTYKGHWRHVNHMPAHYRNTLHAWMKKCNNKKRCNFQPRITPSARITCMYNGYP